MLLAHSVSVMIRLMAPRGESGRLLAVSSL
jgi:hypothetical protein